MFIIRKRDGSIKFAITNDYINQHSNNVNVVYFAIEDLDTAKWSADCLFTLPDSSAIVLAGIPTQFTYSGENYNGYKVPLSSPITMYAGTLGINARNYDEYGNILYSFPFEQTINATASADLIEVPITVAQYNSFMAMLTTYLNAYDSHLVRKYDTLALANADIANLALLSVVLIKNESGNYDLYRKNDTTTLAKVSLQATPIDLTNYYTKSEIDTKTNAYQVALDAEIQARIEAINTINQTTYETTYYNANNEVVKNYDTLGKIKS